MTDNVINLPGSKPPGSVGYKNPPVHSRFKPGQSGNPSGRAKGSQNLKTLFHKIMKEQVQLREGTDVRKVSKAEAIMRGLIIGALKGDTRAMGTLLRLAEQTRRPMKDSESEQQAAALEIVRREAVRSGRSPRAVLSLVRVSDPPTKSEQLLLSAVRLLRSSHAIMPHPCKDMEEWTTQYAPD